MAINSVESLFKDELKDVYDAEKRLTKALPKMAKAAASEDLKKALQEHLELTKNHVSRLEQVFQLMEMKPQSKPCEAMKGLIEEGDQVITSEKASDALSDLSLVGAGRRVEHYEMAAYKTLIALAAALDNGEEIEGLLSQTLDEEEQADQTLADLSEGFVEEASSEGDQEEETEDADQPQTTSTSRR